MFANLWHVLGRNQEDPYSVATTPECGLCALFHLRRLLRQQATIKGFEQQDSIMIAFSFSFLVFTFCKCCKTNLVLMKNLAQHDEKNMSSLIH